MWRYKGQDLLAALYVMMRCQSRFGKNLASSLASGRPTQWSRILLLMRKKLLCAPVIVALLTGLSGCGGSGSSSSASTTAHVRVVNASPDSTSINFSLNDKVVASGLAYLSSSSSFANYSPDSYDVIATEASAVASLSDEVDTLSANTNYLVIGYGLENYGSEPLKRFAASPFTVDLSVPNGNKARIIVFNGFSRAAGFDTPAIDFEDGTTPQFPLTNIAFGATASELVDAGTISFQVTRNGTTQQYATDAGTAFAAGKVYLALVTGVEGQTGVEAPQIKYILLN